MQHALLFLENNVVDRSEHLSVTFLGRNFADNLIIPYGNMDICMLFQRSHFFAHMPIG
jgi:hypothetical protein